MDIKGLTVGQELKSYRELCEVLGIKVEAGNSKKAQLKEVDRYIKLSKGKGYRLIVDEIYETPKEKVKNRRNDVYGEMLQLAVMDYLINSKRSKTTATRNYLLGQVELINENYRKWNSNRMNFSKHANIDIGIVNDFFNISNGNFRRILERSLDVLEDKSIIKYSIVTIVSNTNGVNKKATDKEMEFILECEKEILNEMDYEKKSSVRMSGKWHVFNSKVKKLLLSRSDIHYYYSSYEISVNQKFIIDERDKVERYIISETERLANRDKLTDTLSDNLVDSAAKRQGKARVTSEMNAINKRARCTFTYVEDIQRIANYVINPQDESVA